MRRVRRGRRGAPKSIRCVSLIESGSTVSKNIETGRSTKASREALVLVGRLLVAPLQFG